MSHDHDLLSFRDACGKIWGEELKSMVEDRGKRGEACTVCLQLIPLPASPSLVSCPDHSSRGMV